MDELTRMFMPLASKMAGMTELGDITDRLASVLHKHRSQAVPYAQVPVCLSPEHGGVSVPWPCGAFTQAACVLRLVEIFDGSRFADTWRGPVEERRW